MIYIFVKLSGLLNNKNMHPFWHADRMGKSPDSVTVISRFLGQ